MLGCVTSSKTSFSKQEPCEPCVNSLFVLCFSLLTVRFCYKYRVAISESRKTNMGKAQWKKKSFSATTRGRQAFRECKVLAILTQVPCQSISSTRSFPEASLNMVALPCHASGSNKKKKTWNPLTDAKQRATLEGINIRLWPLLGWMGRLADESPCCSTQGKEKRGWLAQLLHQGHHKITTYWFLGQRITRLSSLKA